MTFASEASEDRKPALHDDHLGSYAYEALRLGERIAEEMILEAAEWSVLYAKELGEPG